MNLDDLKSRVSLDLATQPQRQALAASAMESIREGLARLASLGYRLEIVESGQKHEPEAPQEYPKMLYRSEAPGEITVQDELDERKARESGYAMRDEPMPLPQPAVYSQPVNPTTAVSSAPKPAVTDKQATEARMEAGVGASKPNIPGA